MPPRLRIDAVLRAVDRISRPMRRMQDRVARAARSMRRGFERVHRVASRVTRVIGSALKRAAIGAVVGVTVLTAAVMKLSGHLDDLAKESKRLDFPIEALQEWRFVASQSGVETGAFSKGLQTFAKRLGEAKMGFGTLKEALGRSNPAFMEQLKNTKDVSQAFELYLDAIRKAPRATDKIALATTAFGRSGAELVNITHLTTEQIAALRREQIENGNVTIEQARNAEALIDALDSLKRSGMGLMQSVFAPLIPMITKVARQIREWVVANRELVTSKIKEWGQFIVDNWREIVTWAKRIGKAIVVVFALTAALKILIGVMTVVNIVMSANPIGLIIIAIAALVGAIVALVSNWDEAMISIKASITVAANWFKDKWTAVGNWFKNIWNNIVAFFDVIWESITDVFGGAIDTITSAFSKATNFIYDVFKPVGRFFAGIWRGMTDVVDKFTTYFKDEIQAVGDFFTGIWDGIADSFASIWQGMKDVFWGFVNGVKDLFKSLGKIVGIVSDEVGKKFDKKLKIQTEINPPDVIPDRGGILEQYKNEAMIEKMMKEYGLDRKTVLEVRENVVAKIQSDKAASDRNIDFWKSFKTTNKQNELLAMQSNKLFTSGTLAQMQSKTNNTLEDILLQEEIASKKQVDAINKQSANMGGAMRNAMRDVAKVVNQRYIDISAPYKHFLRAEGSEFQAGSTTTSPQERMTRNIIESQETSRAEVTIKDDTNRAQVTGGKLGSNIQLLPTGTF